ncbi:hypothetical protein [Hydrogenophaga sp. NFH-34]|uniref:hypothetical protein n=1 Tax=Hydrogenophaga sp. NFH-34 TaxID=2744446 RepID=UPI001F39CDF0|nr:hypothetical protein [Hydrogenophaga sp. NFH-34]
MSKKKMTLCVDLCAYVTLDLPMDTDMSEENLKKLAKQADEDGEFNGQDVIYQADWSTQEGLRIVCTEDEGGDDLSDIPVDQCPNDAGLLLRTYLAGQGPMTLEGLVKEAAPFLGINLDDQEMFEGQFKIPGWTVPVKVSFQCRKDATKEEKDLAFFSALVEETPASFDYLCVGSEQAVSKAEGMGA